MFAWPRSRRNDSIVTKALEPDPIIYLMETISAVTVVEFPAGIRPSVGWVLAQTEASTESRVLENALAAAAEGLRDREPLPAIEATRRAFRALGKDPARYRPSADALARRIRKGEGPPLLDPRVDVGTLVSLETGFSIGVYDADRLEPPLAFRPACAGERYLGIGGIDVNLEGLPVFVDRDGAFGSPYRDSARTAIRPETRTMFFVLYGFAPYPVDGHVLALARERLTVHLRARILASALAP